MLNVSGSYTKRARCEWHPVFILAAAPQRPVKRLKSNGQQPRLDTIDHSG